MNILYLTAENGDEYEFIEQGWVEPTSEVIYWISRQQMAYESTKLPATADFGTDNSAGLNPKSLQMLNRWRQARYAIIVH